MLRRVVRWGEGWIPVRISPENIRTARAQIRELCISEDRDPAEIEITIHSQPPDKSIIKAFGKAGADRVLIGLGAPEHHQALEELESIAKETQD